MLGWVLRFGGLSLFGEKIVPTFCSFSYSDVPTDFLTDFLFLMEYRLFFTNFGGLHPNPVHPVFTFAENQKREEV